jgi:ribonuclease HII
MQESILKLIRDHHIIVDGNSPFIPKGGIKNRGVFTDAEIEIQIQFQMPSILKEIQNS